MSNSIHFPERFVVLIKWNSSFFIYHFRCVRLCSYCVLTVGSFCPHLGFSKFLEGEAHQASAKLKGSI